jgi:hypothetical protein
MASDVVCLGPLPFKAEGLPLKAKQLAAEADASRASDHGLHLAWRDGGQAWILRSALPDKPLAFILPAVDHSARRQSAVAALRRKVGGQHEKPAPPTQRRRQLTLALRALRGRAAGFSYREIASALFGIDRIPTGSSWKSSDLRSRTLRLAAAGRAYCDGDYLKLLS